MAATTDDHKLGVFPQSSGGQKSEKGAGRAAIPVDTLGDNPLFASSSIVGSRHSLTCGYFTPISVVFCILGVLMPIVWLWHCATVLQDVTIGRNWVKVKGALSTLFLRIACESAVVSKSLVNKTWKKLKTTMFLYYFIIKNKYKQRARKYVSNINHKRSIC